MQKDIRNLRIRFVIIVVAIVAVILGFILGSLCWIINLGLHRMHIDPVMLTLIMRGIFNRAFLFFLFGVCIFTIIAFVASKWMVRPVEQTWKEQKQFVSDASHELKTPLTVITTNAELLSASDVTSTDKDKYTNNILLVSKGMKALIEDLLNLARIEKGEAAGFAKFNLSQVVSTMCLHFEPVMYELGLELKENISENVAIYGSDQRCAQLVGNLLDNASKYATGGSVDIELKLVNRNAVISVENASAPLMEVQLKDIFKRFYRTDESHTEKGSYGLGLSIAKSICEAHGGKIHAEYKGGKFKIIASLPVGQK